MKLKLASRKQTRIKCGFQGPSGSGKTYSALLLAYGLCGDWTKVAVIDTENKSASLYAHLGPFNVLDLKSPFHPEKFIEAIHVCENGGMQVIIVDSISHEWEGTGGILDSHASMAGNSFTNWGKLTPRHNAFIECLLQSPCHVIGNIRTKQDYVLVEKNGKQVPEKVGLKAITRDGLDYEFTLVFDVDIKHHVTASKDRTGLFVGKPEFHITMETGKTIAEWCASATNEKPLEVSTRINACKTVDELLALYNGVPEHQEILLPDFTKKRQELINSHSKAHQS